MSRSSLDDDQAADRLAFFMVKEVYAAAASVMTSLDAEVAQALFRAVDRRITDALQHMVAEQTEGPASNAIALAVGARLVEVLEHAHGREGVPRANELPDPSRQAAPSPSTRPITRDEALKVVSAFRDAKQTLRRSA